MKEKEQERKITRKRRYTADGEEILPGFFCDYGRYENDRKIILLDPTPPDNGPEKGAEK